VIISVGEIVGFLMTLSEMQYYNIIIFYNCLVLYTGHFAKTTIQILFKHRTA